MGPVNSFVETKKPRSSVKFAKETGIRPSKALLPNSNTRKFAVDCPKGGNVPDSWLPDMLNANNDGISVKTEGIVPVR
jgi:hypothetical protein